VFISQLGVGCKNKKKLVSLNVKEENGQCISLPIFGMVAIF
jgi:hypothetical protein